MAEDEKENKKHFLSRARQLFETEKVTGDITNQPLGEQVLKPYVSLPLPKLKVKKIRS